MCGCSGNGTLPMEVWQNRIDSKSIVPSERPVLKLSELKLFKNSHPGDDAQRNEGILKFKLTSSEVGHTHTHTAVESFCLLDFKRAAIEHRRQTVSKIRRSHTLLCRMYVSNRTILQSTSATYPFN